MYRNGNGVAGAHQMHDIIAVTITSVSVFDYSIITIKCICRSARCRCRLGLTVCVHSSIHRHKRPETRRKRQHTTAPNGNEKTIFNWFSIIWISFHPICRRHWCSLRPNEWNRSAHTVFSRSKNAKSQIKFETEMNTEQRAGKRANNESHNRLGSRHHNTKSESNWFITAWSLKISKLISSFCVCDHVSVSMKWNERCERSSDFIFSNLFLGRFNLESISSFAWNLFSIPKTMRRH